jgi:UDP-N-acetylmuramoyl-L-alanyl-D-glutamate--2,6-diaminopimelate ligase
VIPFLDLYQRPLKLQLATLYPDASDASSIFVTALCEDTRRAVPGSIFFAHTGSKQNGLSFISSALVKGCVAIVVPENTNDADLPQELQIQKIPVIRVLNTRADIARCASIMYPKQPKNIFAVTGTSGKTSVTFFVQQFLNALKKPAVSIGTIGVMGAFQSDETLTTPEAPELHELLEHLVERNIQYAAIEASSQAIVQHRIDAVHIVSAAFTNLSQDHLDYHHTMDEYFKSKSILFSNLLSKNGSAIINGDDPRSIDLLNITKERGIQTITFGTTPNNDFYIHDHNNRPGGQQARLTTQAGSFMINTSISGPFQIPNMVCALALLSQNGFALNNLIECVPNLIAPPGRLEYINGHPKNAHIYVDYAHKPDALMNVLKSLRPPSPNRLYVVFGCGGDRDSKKRALMGDIAARYADDVIITDDNPRSEDAQSIRNMILSGAKGARTPARIRDISNRYDAISTAISELNKNDILIIAGKGHEQGQKFHTHTDPFDDRLVARDILKMLTASHLTSPPHKGQPS